MRGTARNFKFCILCSLYADGQTKAKEHDQRREGERREERVAEKYTQKNVKKNQRHGDENKMK